ncbi:DUF4335 domain-containing protein [Anabaena sp. PCC 7108]|uniref:DUF4335 domain-containing protein n=1 Tax=Anabaena sp. PCC 7108 TaxID=163908 RepID=UPI000347F562|nr:DUF4335 domain-containing protein [Anabaena sp. PCC 7108]
MPRLNSVIRRYTPPTCTLEIRAQRSPLSRWMGQAVLKQIGFELHFDDPGLSGERKVPIQGDHDQLEVLCNVVTTYVQQLLQKSADNFCLSFLEPQNSNTTSDQPELNDVPPSPSSPKTINSSSMGILEATIYLESSSNLTHKLFLGSLANSTSGPVIQLTLLQLFDLATALDEYSADVIALPNLNSENSFPSLVLPTWTPVAAMLVIAVGFTPLTWQYANSIRQKQQQTAETTTSTTQKVAIEPSPALNSTSPQPELVSPGNLSSPPSGTAALQIPNADSIPPLPNSIVDPTPLSFPNSTIPSTAKTLPKNAVTSEQKTKPALSSNLQTLPTTPNFEENSTGVINQSGITLPTREILTTKNSSISKIPQSLASMPKETQSQTSPQISSQLDSQPLDRINSPDSNSSVSSDANVVAKLRNATKTSSSTEASSNTTLFDIPQVAEAREFLQKTWQPPSGFSQTLEYSLMLGVDGSIERILPLNRAAREYVNTTGIPEIGKAFVSTNKSGQNIRLRVVLSPDGKVQTFPETP